MTCCKKISYGMSQMVEHIDIVTPLLSLLFVTASGVISSHMAPAKPIELNTVKTAAPTDGYSYNFVLAVWIICACTQSIGIMIHFFKVLRPKQQQPPRLENPAIDETLTPPCFTLSIHKMPSTPAPELVPEHPFSFYANDILMVFMHFSAVAVVIGITEILKISFGGARSYYDVDGNNADNASMGMPSGHSSTSAAIGVCVFIIFDYYFPLLSEMRGWERTRRNVLRMVVMGLCLAFPLGTAVSRHRHYHHTQLQVAFGLTLGTFVALFVCHAFFIPLIRKPKSV